MDKLPSTLKLHVPQLGAQRDDKLYNVLIDGGLKFCCFPPTVKYAHDWQAMLNGALLNTKFAAVHAWL